MGVVSVLDPGLCNGFTSEWSPTVRTVWSWATAVASCRALVWGWVAQGGEQHKALPDPPTPRADRPRNTPARSAHADS